MAQHGFHTRSACEFEKVEMADCGVQAKDACERYEMVTNVEIISTARNNLDCP